MKNVLGSIHMHLTADAEFSVHPNGECVSLSISGQAHVHIRDREVIANLRTALDAVEEILSGRSEDGE